MTEKRKSTAKSSGKSNKIDSLSEYKKIFKNLDENKKVFAEKLYTEADFMFQTLQRLRKIIDNEGAVIKTVNGNGFETYTEHPAQKSYNTMIRNYNATLKQLVDLAPESSSGKKSKLLEMMEDE